MYLTEQKGERSPAQVESWPLIEQRRFILHVEKKGREPGRSGVEKMRGACLIASVFSMKYEARLATIEGLWGEGIGLRTREKGRYDIDLLESRKATLEDCLSLLNAHLSSS